MASSTVPTPSESTNNNSNTSSVAPPSSSPGIPYVGSRISLISKSRIRYVGTLYTIDTKESTVALKDVKSYGTEDRVREGGPIAPSDQIYAYIIFRGPDILDLQFLTTSTDGEEKPQGNNSQDVQSNTNRSVSNDVVTNNVSSNMGSNSNKTELKKEENIIEQQKNKNNRSLPTTSISNSRSGKPYVNKSEDLNNSITTSMGMNSKGNVVRGPMPRAWGPPPGLPTGPNLMDTTQKGNIKQEPTLLGEKEETRNNNTETKTIPQIHTSILGNRGGSSSGYRGRGRGRGGNSNNRGWRRGPGIKIPDEDFDFERMNEKFEKAGLGESGEELPTVEVGYDKTKSFFDELIPEKEMRSERNAAQRRATDFETFGETRGFRHGRSYRSGRGRRGGRGYGRGRRGHSHMNSHHHDESNGIRENGHASQHHHSMYGGRGNRREAYKVNE